MKTFRYGIIAVSILLVLALAGCSGGSSQPTENTYVNRFPAEYNTKLSDYSNIQIKDKNDNDISHIAIDLWYTANEIYNVDDTNMFKMSEQEILINEYELPQSNELFNYYDVVQNIFTENGIKQLEQTQIDRFTPLIRKADNKVYRLGPRKTGYSFAYTLTDMKVKTMEDNTITLDVTYALIDMDYNVLDHVTTSFTITNVDGTWLVDNYVYPEAYHEA